GTLLACRGGLLQLDPRLLALPLSGLASFLAGDSALFLRARARRVVLGLGGALALFWVGFFAAPARATTILASQGAWSRPLIAALQQASDFDRDGYSSFLGGGDCAPFDAAINPGAGEIPGDGVDNNCIGGDAGRASVPGRPLWGPSAHGSPTNLNVVIVTIETLRRDHASFLHSGHDTTPTLRALAPSCLVFERMYSAAPYTRLALASLFSSYAPSEIDWLLLQPEKHMRHIGPQTPWLPELLRAKGYETIAVLTDFSAFTQQEDIGFQRGFSQYDITTKLEYRGGTMFGFPAEAQVDKALAHLEHAQRPFLLWLHLFEPHYRYEQPPGAPVFGTDEQSRYDAEIWHTDRQLGRLFEGLRKLEVWDDTVLFVSGDHGEAFGEHDDRWHGTNLFDPQLRPAALLRVPGVNGKRVDVAVTFTDVAPTIARVLGDRSIFDQLRGRSLAPLMHHPTLPDGEPGFVAETFNIEDGRAYQAALVSPPLKLIYTEQGRRFALYDLARDPRELRPLEPSSDPRASPLLAQLIGYLERARPRSLNAREAR
ncbi:MAG TPA: sulfatase, partial [Polyangiaceae bacterium]|nr:sulfatase [Polyangiaceae bacterium]